jgi:UDP-glucuronate decarboxylase
MSVIGVIVVTGGAGLIGTTLCTRLIREAEYHVVCVDNFSTSAESNIKTLRELEKNPDKHFKMIVANIRDKLEPDFLKHTFWNSSPHLTYKLHCIYHLACPASPVHYQRTSFSTIMTCVQGTQTVLNWLELEPEARLILASTSEIYGDPLEHPQREEYHGNVNTVGPRSCYDEGKRAMESMARAFIDQYGGWPDIGIVRIFNTYGPGNAMNDGRVVSNFIVNMLKGEPVVIFGDGTQTRCYCYVEDTVDGLIRMAGARKEFGPINIGNPNEITVMELVETIRDLMGLDQSVIIMKPHRQDDPVRRCPVITRATERLGWRPTTNLHDGLLKTIEYFRGVI